MEKFMNFMNSEKLDVKFKKVHQDAIIPKFEKLFDSGIDLRSVEDTLIFPGKIVCVHTGLSVELPDPKDTFPFVLEMQIRPRSGLSAKHGVTVVNSPGTIDSGYRGELIIIMSVLKYDMYNEFDQLQYQEYKINKGDRIAQAVIVPILSTNILNMIEVDELNNTVRGNKGLGSSGVK